MAISRRLLQPDQTLVNNNNPLPTTSSGQTFSYPTNFEYVPSQGYWGDANSVGGQGVRAGANWTTGTDADPYGDYAKASSLFGYAGSGEWNKTLQANAMGPSALRGTRESITSQGNTASIDYALGEKQSTPGTTDYYRNMSKAYDTRMTTDPGTWDKPDWSITSNLRGSGAVASYANPNSPYNMTTVGRGRGWDTGQPVSMRAYESYLGQGDGSFTGPRISLNNDAVNSQFRTSQRTANDFSRSTSEKQFRNAFNNANVSQLLRLMGIK